MDTTIEVGLKELKEFLSWFIKSAEGIASAASDGKITLSDADELLPILTSARKGLGGIDAVKGQFKALFIDHKQDVCDHIQAEFSLADGNLESLIERSISQGLDLVNLGLEWRGYFEQK